MNIESMANYADVIGGIAVIVSLIYVGIQIRRNAKSSQLQAYQSALESVASVGLEVAKDPDLSSLALKGMSAIEKLTEEEQFQFMMLMMTVFRGFENIFYQYKKGFLEEQLWDGYKQSMLLYRFTRGGQIFWDLRSAHYSEMFRNYLDSISPDDVKSELES